MSPKRKNIELIELLAEQAGCTYLSDLQLEEYRCRLEGCLQKMDIERYGEEEWADAAKLPDRYSQRRNCYEGSGKAIDS